VEHDPLHRLSVLANAALSHVVQIETAKNNAIERFVNPPDKTAPSGAGALSASGENNKSTAGFDSTVHLGYEVFPKNTRATSKMNAKYAGTAPK
jgi:hypothetical protein